MTEIFLQIGLEKETHWKRSNPPAWKEIYYYMCDGNGLIFFFLSLLIEKFIDTFIDRTGFINKAAFQVSQEGINFIQAVRPLVLAILGHTLRGRVLCCPIYSRVADRVPTCKEKCVQKLETCNLIRYFLSFLCTSGSCILLSEMDSSWYFIPLFSVSVHQWPHQLLLAK